MRITKRSFSIVISSFLLFHLLNCSPAIGSGFMIKEHSSAGLGTSFAGMQTGSHGLADIFFNPAALADHAKREAAIVLEYLSFESKFSLKSASNAVGQAMPGNPGGGNIAPAVTIPSLYTSIPLRDKTIVGIAINAPWGLKTENPEGWVGRYHALTSSLETMNITPMVSKQVNQKTSLALGLQLQRAEANIENAIDFGLIGFQAGLTPITSVSKLDGGAKIEGSDWGQGFVMGLTHDMSEKSRLGISYRSEVKHTLKGDATFTRDNAGVAAGLAAAKGMFVNTDVEAKLTTPSQIAFGVSADTSDRHTLLFDATRTGWTSFDELRVDFSNPVQPDSVTVEDWHDTWFFSLGGKYKSNDQWTLKWGLAYDQTPVDDVNRNPSLPTSSSRWMSLGATYRTSEESNFDFGFAHLDFGDSPIQLSTNSVENKARGNLVGDFDTKVNIFAISWQTKF